MSLLSLLSLVSLSAPALGLEPYLVKDINPVPLGIGSSPSALVSLGGAAVFSALDDEGALGLWRSDGTAAGTWRLADFCPAGSFCGMEVLAEDEGRAFLTLGSDLWITDGTVAGTLRLTDGRLRVFSDEAAWVPEQRALYFLADDKPHGTELWRSDGTPAGTRLVADLVPGPQSLRAGMVTAFRGQVWFGAWIQPGGGSIWRSDGTENGTVKVLEKGRPSLPMLHGVAGKRLLFSRFGEKGLDLWSTDGTERGTAPILGLRSRIGDSVIHDGRLFFVADLPGHGKELWVSDGTGRGSRVLSGIPGRKSSLSLPETSLPGRFLFMAEDPAHGEELWVSDGTPAGTRLLRDVCPGPCRGVQWLLTANGGLFYFAASDGTHGEELWASDGTPMGTRMVRDLCPGACSSRPSLPRSFAGRLLFAVEDDENGEELWATDGTAAGTVQLTDQPLDLDYSEGAAVTAGSPAVARFLFAADDGEHGTELWSTDGTPAGASLIADINQADFGGSVISGIRALGDQAVFFADDGLHGYKLWKSDGTAAGTDLVAELSPGREPGRPPKIEASAETGGMLFLLLFGDFNFSLWRTDGTPAGTLQLQGADEFPVPYYPSGLCAAGGRVFFIAQEDDLQLWSTDGTVAGTQRVVEAGPDKVFDNPVALAELGGRPYFFATGSNGMGGLWRIDGTAGTAFSTTLVRSLDVVSTPRPTRHAGRLWFFAFAPGGGIKLWSTDGTGAGTRIEPVPGIPQEPGLMASIGAKLMFSGYVEGNRFDMWATDGTPEGTRKVGPALHNGSLDSFPWTVFQGRLVYPVDERFDGSPPVLWTSDGTPEGTGPLRDHDGKRIPAPLGMSVLGDRLIFTTANPAQIWESDGTPEGTVPIAPALPLGFNPGAVGRAGNRVFFGAWDPHTGQELWAVENP